MMHSAKEMIWLGITMIAFGSISAWRDSGAPLTIVAFMGAITVALVLIGIGIAAFFIPGT